jgi:DeoR/GlpR family transcriptional regulator of sugar metabolism
LIWGGAISKTPPTEAEAQVEQRSHLNRGSKQRIGARAAAMIESGQTIILDAGTTTVEIVHHLPQDLDYLRVITPALNVAIASVSQPYIELLMPGGVLRNLTHSLIGPQTLQSLQMFNADLAFIASGGFSLEHGVTTSNTMDADVKRAIVQQAARVILVAGSEKFGKVLSLNVTPLADLDLLISDTLLSDADAAAIEALGVEVIRV